jgi:hypothetical protein
MMETDTPADKKTWKHKHKHYYCPNKGEKGTHCNYPSISNFTVESAGHKKGQSFKKTSIYTGNKQMGRQYQASRNIHLEAGDLPQEAEHLRIKMVGRRPRETWSVPFQDAPTRPYLETEDGKIRGQKHSPIHLKDTFGLTHDERVHAKPYRQAGESISNEAKVNATFERNTCVRRARSYSLPSRSPYGTAYEWDPHYSIRQHTTHYDTRQLLTYAA